MNDEGQGDETEIHFATPGEVLAFQREQIISARMAQQEFRMSVDRLFDELTPDQCYTMYRLMLNISAGGTDTAHHMSGQLAILLRRIHKVCGSCGRGHTEHEHLVLEAEAEAQSHKNETWSSSDEDDGELNGIDEFPDEELDVEGLLHKFKVHPQGQENFDPNRSKVICDDCEVEFKSLVDRREQGLQCPVCKLNEKLNGQAD